MTPKLLLAEADNTLTTAFRNLSEKYQIAVVHSGKQALTACQRESPDAILAAQHLPDMEGTQLVHSLRKNKSTQYVPFVLFSEELNLQARIEAIKSGVDEFISLPFEIEEVQARLDVLLAEKKTLPQTPPVERGFSGNLHEMNLVDLIQTLELGQKTGVIHLTKNNHEGKIYVKNGEVWDAETNGILGEKALMRLFTWDEGVFYVEFQDFDRERVIAMPVQEIVSKGLKITDEWLHLKNHLPKLNTVLERAREPYLDEIDQQHTNILELVDGEHSIEQIVENSPIDELETLRIIIHLFELGIIHESLFYFDTEKYNSETPKEEPTNGKSAPVKEKLLAVISRFFKKILSPSSSTFTEEVVTRPAPTLSKENQEKVKVKLKNQIPFQRTELQMLKRKLLV